MEGKTKITNVPSTDGNPKLDDIALLGKDKLLDLLLYKRRYLTPWDYTSTSTELAESFIAWCNSNDLNPCVFI